MLLILNIDYRNNVVNGQLHLGINLNGMVMLIED